MPVGSKEGTERRYNGRDGAPLRYNLRATPSRSGRVDDRDQEAGAARFPDTLRQKTEHVLSSPLGTFQLNTCPLMASEMAVVTAQ